MKVGTIFFTQEQKSFLNNHNLLDVRAHVVYIHSAVYNKINEKFTILIDYFFLLNPLLLNNTLYIMYELFYATT